MDICNKEQITERKGKSWKREREERGKRHQVNGERKCHNIDDEGGGGNHKDIKISGTCGSVEVTDKDSSSQAELEKQLEEKLRLEEEESQRLAEEIHQKELRKEMLVNYVEEAQERLQAKASVRAINRNVASLRPDEHYFSKLDSSLKKNTAFVRKVRNFTAAQRDVLAKDLEHLNLTKYISEVAAALVEAKLKMIDVGPAVQLCSWVHQKYMDFSGHLLENWQKALTLKKDERNFVNFVWKSK